MTAAYDVFVSYARADGARVTALVKALRARGLRVWFDETDVSDFASITRGIVDGLANAKALVAVYSDTYPTRRACQWELTAAFLAAQQEDEPRPRVLVINPESHSHHILPIDLQDALFRSLPGPEDEEGLTAVATSVCHALANLPGPLSNVRPLAQPPWYGGKGLGSNRFVGRIGAFWEVHSALFANNAAVITAQSAPGHAHVRGMGGVGKSLFAEEYALRFGAAYPGGVFLLKGTGGRDEQIADVAARLGLLGSVLSPPQIEGWLERHLREVGTPYLWLVDDLNGGMDVEEHRRWFAPNGLGKTLITTRSREYAATGGVIDLGVLGATEGYELLTAKRTPEGPDEEKAACEIVAELGGHALALDVAGGALFHLIGREGFEGFLAEIRAPEPDALAAAAELRPELPNGHERSIATTLLATIDLLDEPGRDFLRLASVLAPDVIPYDLVDAVFKEQGSGTGWGATALMRAVLSNCLADVSPAADGHGSYSVHSLVRRTMRLYDKEPARQGVLRELAVRTLNQLLPRVTDIRTHQGLRAHVAHAGHLAASPSSRGEANLLLWVGRHEYERGAYGLARRHQETVLEATRRLFGDDDSATLCARYDLARSLLELGDLLGARQHAEAVLSAYLRLLGEEDPSTLSARSILAQTLRAKGDTSGARQHQEAVLEARRRVLGDEHPETLTARSNLAKTLRDQRDAHGAREHQEAVLEARRRVLGNDHPETLVAENNLAATLFALGDLKGARERQEASVDATRNLLGDEHPNTLAARHNLAVTLRADGDLSGARQHEEFVVRAMARLFGADHPKTISARRNLAAILCESDEGSRQQG